NRWDREYPAGSRESAATRRSWDRKIRPSPLGQRRMHDLVEPADVDAEPTAGVIVIEHVCEPGLPDELLRLVGGPSMDRRREGLVVPREHDDELGIFRHQRVRGRSAERTVLVDGMHHRPRRWEERHLPALEGQAVVVPERLAVARLHPAQDDLALDLEQLALAQVDHPEL